MYSYLTHLYTKKEGIDFCLIPSFSKLGAGKPEQRQAQSARPTIMEE